MPFPLFRRNRASRTIAALYGAIVAQARLPIFYRAFGVPDSVEGRLDLIMLHAILLVLRLERGDAELRALAPALFEHFCRDMDDNLREMGVGDLAVPRKMRQIGEAFYGRRAAYVAALAGEDADLAAAIARNVLDGAPGRSDEARDLALYVRSAARELDAQHDAILARGTVAFPEPRRGPLR